MAVTIGVVSRGTVCLFAMGLIWAGGTYAQTEGGEAAAPAQDASPAQSPSEGSTSEPAESPKAKPVKIPEVVVKDVHERNEPDQESVKDIA